MAGGIPVPQLALHPDRDDGGVRGGASLSVLSGIPGRQRGIAVLLGSALALDWRLFLILVAGVAVITFITDYMFIGTLSASVGYLVWCILTGRSGWDIAIMAATVALIFWKHRKNFVRLVKGKELGIRASIFKKKYRVDKKTPEPLRLLPAAKSTSPVRGEAS